MAGACGEAPADSLPGDDAEAGAATTEPTVATSVDETVPMEPAGTTTSSPTSTTATPDTTSGEAASARTPSTATSSSATSAASPTSTTAAPATTGTPLPQPDAGDISGFEIVNADLGDRSLWVALADTPVLRSRGLMGVTSLGDLDGMLFAWDAPVQVSFWMKDTLIPLDIGFFDESGSLFLVASMVPCQADPCPTYPSEAPVRYALEALPGFFDAVALGEILFPRKNAVAP